MMKIKIEDSLFRLLQRYLLSSGYILILLFFSSCSTQSEVAEVINGNSFKLTNGTQITLIGVLDNNSNFNWLRDSLTSKEVTVLNKDKEILEDFTSTKIEAFVYTEDGVLVNKKLDEGNQLKTELNIPRNVSRPDKNIVLTTNKGNPTGDQSIRLCSWNLKDFGQSKSNEEIRLIADIVNEFDVLAIQEVVAGPGGTNAVRVLADELNRKGSKWDYSISNPTSSGSTNTSERYAFIWRSSLLTKIGDAWLEQNYQEEIDREPFFAKFKANQNVFTLVNFHAAPKGKQPEHEIKYFKFLHELYTNSNFIFVGDFNCPQYNNVFSPLKKQGYLPALVNQKTTLKQECHDGECLASEYDNIFYDSNKVSSTGKGIIEFYQSFSSLENARFISDHVPIYFAFSFK
jgi:deoxyribonuclease-1-like protein